MAKPSPKSVDHLRGMRIALTIAPEEAAATVDDLRAAGATLIFYPVAQPLPPDNYDDLDAALTGAQRDAVTWLLLTSPHAVEAVATRLHQRGIDVAELSRVSLALFGAQTALVASTLLAGWHATQAQAETHAALVESMRLAPRDTVLIPLAQRSRADWPDLIAATGAAVEIVDAYRLLLGRGGDDLPGLLWEGLVDAVVFFTETSVRHFATRLKADGGTLDMIRDVRVICFDHATAAAARAFGLAPHHILPADSLPAPAHQLAQALRPTSTRA